MSLKIQMKMDGENVSPEVPLDDPEAEDPPSRRSDSR